MQNIVLTKVFAETWQHSDIAENKSDRESTQANSL